MGLPLINKIIEQSFLANPLTNIRPTLDTGENRGLSAYSLLFFLLFHFVRKYRLFAAQFAIPVFGDPSLL